MSFQVKRGEEMGEALRRLCLGQVRRALEIATGERETEGSPVHQTRKHLKKARAVLHLVEKEIGRREFKRLDRRLRDTGRLVSEVRDAEVRLQTVRELQQVGKKNGGFRKVEETLLLDLQNFLSAFAEWQVEAIPRLCPVREAVAGWSLEKFGPKQYARCLQTTYKCGREALARAQEKPTAECFHELRKQAKRLWYQVRIIRPHHPVVLRRICDEIRNLTDMLGKAHDLSFLAERVEKHPEPDWQGERGELLELVARSEGELLQAATELAGRFFAERPRDFGKRVAGWLEGRDEASSVAEALLETPPPEAVEMASKESPPV